MDIEVRAASNPLYKITAREREQLAGLVLRSYDIGRQALSKWQGAWADPELQVLDQATRAVLRSAQEGCVDQWFLFVVDQALHRALLCLDARWLSWDQSVIEQADDDYELIAIAINALRVVAKRRKIGA